MKDRQFTMLNLFGLSTGLACTMLIYLWVNDELQVDKFNEKDKQLFQIMMNMETPNGIETGEQSPGLLAQALTKELPEVEYATSVITVSWADKTGILTYQGNHITATNQFAGKDYFNIFSYHFIDGNKTTPLSDKSSIVISRELAMKIFKTTQNVVGKSIEWNQKEYSGVYRISGIFENPPVNATIQFDIAFQYELFLDKNPNLQKWSNNQPATYVILKPGTDINQFNDKIAGFIKTRHDKSKATLFAQKFSDRYLQSHYENGLPNGGRIDYVNLFSITAIFILLIACINFMNLSTAKAIRRIREAGIKKILGAQRSTLIAQTLGESLLLAFLSTIIAIGFVFLLLPQFNLITGKQLSIPFNLNFILTILSITVIARLDALYKKDNNGLPFEYRFLDEDYQGLYASEKKVATLSKYFAGLAIIISCLGLFGLAAFTAQKRQKEIGIRKVVGASTNNVMILLSKDFLKLVLISILIAFPISLWAMYQWLHGFAYRVDLGIDIFVIAAISTILITMLSIGFQSLKAAVTNPIKSLRSE